jgi:transposase InsO family protein
MVVPDFSSFVPAFSTRHSVVTARKVRESPKFASKASTIIPDAIDTMWGTDMTTTWTAEGQVAVFIAVDHHNAECVGIHAARRGTRFEALEPLRQGVQRHFGAIGKEIAEGLTVRHDHGPQYMSDTFQTEMRFLGHSEFARLRSCA